MKEVELKILIDEETLRSVSQSDAFRRMAQARASTRMLDSVYYDTEDEALASAGIALRVRKVGRTWVQTVKQSAGAIRGGLSDVRESESRVTGGAVDPEQIEDAALRVAVMSRMDGRALIPVCGTRIKRTARHLAHEGAEVECALDTGEIIAGERTAPISELELELKSGPPAALYAIAREILPSRAVRFSSLSKAARAQALARTGSIATDPMVRRAKNVDLSGNRPLEIAARDMLIECLDQIAANMAVLAVSNAPEGPHQLRIGFRRLRTVIGLLRPVMGCTPLDDLNRRAQALAADVGRLRDLDVLADDLLTILPGETVDPGVARLREAIMVRRETVREAVVETIDGAAGRDFVLDLGAAIAGRPWLDEGDYGQTASLAAPVRRRFAKALDKRWKAVTRLGRRIETLEDDGRHELRKSLKKLRYTLEFAKGTLPKKRASGFVKRLKKLQDRFGALNDMAMAEALLMAPDAPGADDPLASRAAGRLIGQSAERAVADRKLAEAAWKNLAAIGPVWR